MLRLSLVTLLLVVPAAAQTASYTFRDDALACRGHPIMGPFYRVTFDVTGLPRLGSHFSVQSDWPYTGRVPLLITGVSNKWFGPHALPLDPRIVAPGPWPWCGHLQTSVELVQTGGQWTFNIPNDSRLLGLQFYQQVLDVWFIVHAQLSLSRLGQAVIGT
jgi:hypothetical protein